MSSPETQPSITADLELGESVRRLARNARRTTVAPAQVAEATALIAKAATLLGDSVYEGPTWQTGLSSFDDFRLEGTPNEMFAYSPAIGSKSPVAPRVSLEVVDRAIVGTAYFEEQYGGPPWDITHGGIVALVHDEMVGMAAAFGAGGGLTASLTINYRRPVPLRQEVELRAWYEHGEGRKFVAKGEMWCDGELLNESEGLFIQPREMADLAAKAEKFSAPESES